MWWFWWIWASPEICNFSLKWWRKPLSYPRGRELPSHMQALLMNAVIAIITACTSASSSFTEYNLMILCLSMISFFHMDEWIICNKLDKCTYGRSLWCILVVDWTWMIHEKWGKNSMTDVAKYGNYNQPMLMCAYVCLWVDACCVLDACRHECEGNNKLWRTRPSSADMDPAGKFYCHSICRLDFPDFFISLIL